MMFDHFIPSSRCQNIPISRESTYSWEMILPFIDNFSFLDIKKLDFTCWVSNRHKISKEVGRQRSHYLVNFLNLIKFACLACLGVPKIDTILKSNRNNILSRPVKHIKIKIISNLWSIKHFIWLFWNFSNWMNISLLRKFLLTWNTLYVRNITLLLFFLLWVGKQMALLLSFFSRLYLYEIFIFVV